MDSETMAGLLKEAQDELRSIRSSLFAERRVSEERRKLLEELQKQLQSTKDLFDHQGKELVDAQAVAASVNSLTRKFQESQSAHEASMIENRNILEAKRVLEKDLREMREKVDHAERRAMLSESERGRLQQSQSEAAAQLRLAQRQAAEAESEQMNAEEESQVLRSELETLRAAISLDLSSNPASQSFPAEPVMTMNPSGKQSSSMGGALSPLSASQLQHLLEGERTRAAMLLQNLQLSRMEANSLREELENQMRVAREAMERYEYSVGKQREEEEMRRRAKEGDRHNIRLQETQAELDATRQELAAARKALSLQPHTPLAPSVSSHGLLKDSKDSSSNAELLAMLDDAKRVEASALSHSLSHPLEPQVGPELSGLSKNEHHALVSELEHLVSQVVKLKLSRDKLLEEIDAQWQEMDRSSSEHQVQVAGLISDLQAERKISSTWEAQAQDALAQCERLKELLEEGLSWANVNGNEVGTNHATMEASTTVAKLLKLLSEERLRSAELELGARALAAELVRAQLASMSIGRSMLPVYCGIEGKLEGMVERARMAVAREQQLLEIDNSSSFLAVQGS